MLDELYKNCYTDVMLKTLADVNEYLRDYYSLSGPPKLGTNYALEDTFELARCVGNPQERLKVVHVAGTSGKTSTSYMMAALLRESGKKVGLTVSPHISSIKERVQIDGEVLDDETFIGLFREYSELVEQGMSKRPSYFELMMIFALWVFDKVGVDYAVVETGLGGMYDTSNVCRREDKLCIITDIGFDHTHILGNTLALISEQKAGIIANGNHVCMYEQSGEVMSPVRDVAEHFKAVLHTYQSSDGTYYERNFGLARHAYAVLVERDGLGLLDEAQLERVRHTQVPGRLEKIRVGDTTFVLDGAHNEQKMRTLFATLDRLYPGKKWPIALALKHDKDISDVATLIRDHAEHITATAYQQGQDMPIASTPVDELAALFAGDDVTTIPVLSDALQLALDRADAMVLVTGSLYAVAEARAWLLDQKQGIVEA